MAAAIRYEAPANRPVERVLGVAVLWALAEYLVYSLSGSPILALPYKVLAESALFAVVLGVLGVIDLVWLVNWYHRHGLRVWNAQCADAFAVVAAFNLPIILIVMAVFLISSGP